MIKKFSFVVALLLNIDLNKSHTCYMQKATVNQAKLKNQCLQTERSDKHKAGQKTDFLVQVSLFLTLTLTLSHVCRNKDINLTEDKHNDNQLSIFFLKVVLCASYVFWFL